MATYYVSNESGANAPGRGSSALPYLTIAYMLSDRTLASGDTVNLEGTFREFNTISTALTGVTFQQWPVAGKTQAVIRGDVVAGSGGWSASGAGYTKNIGAGLNVKSVVSNWDANVDSSGRHYGHLKLASSAANALATLNNWFYNSGTGVLSLNIGADPAGGALAYCLGGNDALLKFTNATNCTVSGIQFALHCDGTAGKGYGVWMAGSGNTIVGCRADDCGYHSFGMVGGSLVGNTISDCVCSGIVSGGIHLVFYADVAGSTGSRGQSCTLYCHTLLGLDGVTPVLAGTANACYSHTDGIATLGGLTWRGITCIWMGTNTGDNGTGFACANIPNVTPSGVDDYRTYDVQVIGCSTVNGRTQITSSSIGFHNCTFDTTKAGWDTNPWGWFDIADGATKHVCFDSCEFLWDSDVATNARLFRLWSANNYHLINCAGYNRGTGANAGAYFNGFNAATYPNVKARGCIFAHNPASVSNFRHLYVTDGDNGSKDFADCVYVFIGTGEFSDASYGTAALWAANVDTTGLFTSTNPYAAPATNLGLTPSGTVYAKRMTASVHTVQGINGSAYTNNVGAWQYGRFARSRDYRGRPSFARV